MKSASFFAALNLTGKRCLVVGTGDEAERRVQALLGSGAGVWLVTDSPTPLLLEYSRQSRLTLKTRSFQAQDMQNLWLAILTTRDAELAEEIGKLAEQERVFFCAIDQPARNSFAHMALAKAGLVTVAISTEGRAPGLGRKLRDELESLFKRANLELFAEKVATIRTRAAPAERASVVREAIRHVRISGELELEA